MDEIRQIQCQRCGKVLRVLEDIKDGKCIYCSNEIVVNGHPVSEPAPGEAKIPGQAIRQPVIPEEKMPITALPGVIRETEPVPIVPITSLEKPQFSNLPGLIVLLSFLLICVAVIAVYIVINLEIPEDLTSIKISEWQCVNTARARLGEPRGIALSPDNQNVFISMADSNIIAKFTADGVYLSGWGKKGTGPGEFNEPSGINTDSSGNLYVTDAWNGRIQKFTPEGVFILQIGNSKNAFYSPRNVAISRDGVVFVADTGTSRLLTFDASGNRIGAPTGGHGRGPGKFEELFGIAFDSKGRVFIADAGNARIQVFSREMAPESQVEVNAWKKKPPLWPMLAIDSKDRLYAVSSGTGEIIVYDASKERLKYLFNIRKDVEGSGLFSNPINITIDKEDNIYVLDTAKNSIFKIKPDFEKKYKAAVTGPIKKANATVPVKTPVAMPTIRPTPVIDKKLAFGVRLFGVDGKENNPGDINETQDRGYIFTYNNLMAENIHLIKADVNGKTVFEKNIHVMPGNNESGHAIKTGDGGFLLSGCSRKIYKNMRSITSTPLLIKIDESGKVVWSKSQAEPYAGGKLTPTADGGYIISAVSRGFPYLVKTDISGNVKWRKELDYQYLIECGFIGCLTDGYFYLASFPMSYDRTSWIKTDLEGNYLTMCLFSNFSLDHSSKQPCVITPDGYTVIGSSKGAKDGLDMCLVFLGANGKEKGRKIFRKKFNTYGASIIQTADKGYMLLGNTAGPGNDMCLYLVKTDSAGNPEFEKTIGWGGYDCASSMIKTAEGDFVIIGLTYSFNTTNHALYKVFLIKVNAKGDML